MATITDVQVMGMTRIANSRFETYHLRRNCASHSGGVLLMLQTESARTAPGCESMLSPLRRCESIADRERVSDWYWTRKDNLIEMRVWWRATTARHMLHLLPGETILELGCGSGTLTRALEGVSRRECPITAATFDPKNDLSWLSSSLPVNRGSPAERVPRRAGRPPVRLRDRQQRAGPRLRRPAVDRGPEAPQAGGPAVILRNQSVESGPPTAQAARPGASRSCGGATSG